jgi:PEP-CTERM motif
MKIATILCSLLMISSVPASSAVTMFKFSGSVTLEFENNIDTTGQGLGPVRVGDQIRGQFKYDDSVEKRIPPSRPDIALFSSAISESRLDIYRSNQLILTMQQRPIFDNLGNLYRTGNMTVENRDPRGLRDLVYITADRLSLDGPVISSTPRFQNIEYSQWSSLFREGCATGSITTGNCVSNSPDLDLYDGSQSSADLAKAFNTGSEKTVDLFFQYDFSNFSAARAEITSFAAVPEPAVWTFMVFGFGMVGAMTRRQKKNHDQLRAKLA